MDHGILVSQPSIDSYLDCGSRGVISWHPRNACRWPSCRRAKEGRASEKKGARQSKSSCDWPRPSPFAERRGRSRAKVSVG